MPIPKLPKRAARIAVAVAILYLLALTGVWFGQRHFLYFPSRLSLELATADAARAGFIPWKSSTGEIIGWKHSGQTNAGVRPRILITHGNAGSAIDRIWLAETLALPARFDVYILEYPGYGPRPGSPSQESLFGAADKALERISGDGPVYILGESLGTGVASYLAGAHPRNVAALLLIAPYHNLGDVAQHHMSIFPARWMLWDRFASGDNLKNYHGPVAVLLDGLDTVVPNRFGRRLYDGYSGPKRVWEVPSGAHGALPEHADNWWREVVEFWNKRGA
jgi:pimeloyl-ACP methyl ester carboxylesterase